MTPISYLFKTKKIKKILYTITFLLISIFLFSTNSFAKTIRNTQDFKPKEYNQDIYSYNEYENDKLVYNIDNAPYIQEEEIPCLDFKYDLRYNPEGEGPLGDIYKLQLFLYKSGYTNYPPSGSFGALTKTGLVSYQYERGLNPSGTLDLVTRLALSIDTCHNGSLLLNTLLGGNSVQNLNKKVSNSKNATGYNRKIISRNVFEDPTENENPIIAEISTKKNDTTESPFRIGLAGSGQVYIPSFGGGGGGGGSNAGNSGNNTQYTVTFNLNGGTTTASQNTFSVISGATFSNIIVAKGTSTFHGWYTDSNFTTKYNFDSKNNSPQIYSNLTLYAKWFPLSCGVDTLATTSTNGIPCTITMTSSINGTNATTTIGEQNISWGTGLFANPGTTTPRQLKYGDTFIVSCTNTTDLWIQNTDKYTLVSASDLGASTSTNGNTKSISIPYNATTSNNTFQIVCSNIGGHDEKGTDDNGVEHFGSNSVWTHFRTPKKWNVKFVNTNPTQNLGNDNSADSTDFSVSQWFGQTVRSANGNVDIKPPSKIGYVFEYWYYTFSSPATTNEWGNGDASSRFGTDTTSDFWNNGAEIVYFAKWRHVIDSPTSLSFTNVSTSSLTFNWATSTGATGYEIYWATGSSWSLSGDTPTPSDAVKILVSGGDIKTKDLTGFATGTQYTFGIRATSSNPLYTATSSLSLTTSTSTLRE